MTLQSNNNGYHNGENLKKDYHMLWIYAILSLTIRHLP